MKQFGLVFLTLVISVAFSPARAVPPTATPSPGYDARLQESRAGSATNVAPASRPPKPSPKKPAKQ